MDSLLCKDSQDELSLFIRFETGRHNQVVACGQFEPARNLPQVDESLAPGTASIVAEEISCAPSWGFISQRINSKSTRKKIQSFISHSSSSLLHQIHNHCTFVFIITFIRILKTDQELRIISKSLNVVSSTSS